MKRIAVALTLSVALVSSLFVAAPDAQAQVEDAMTPTPTPAPAVSPIPVYREAGSSGSSAGSAGSSSNGDGAGTNGLTIDRAGMFGAGFMIGNTSTGATAKIWFSQQFAMQLSAGAGPLGNNVRFQLDLLYNYYRWEAEDGIYALPFYMGMGAQAGIFFKNPWPDDRTDFGVRVPIGMSVVIPDNPVEIYFEVAPDFAIYDDSRDDEHFVFYVDGQIGLRYYF